MLLMILLCFTSDFCNVVHYQVVPVLLNSLPLKEDMEENETVYKCILQLFTSKNPVVCFNKSTDYTNCTLMGVKIYTKVPGYNRWGTMGHNQEIIVLMIISWDRLIL